MTNEEKKTELRSQKYTWGRFVDFHEIGEYLIVEYKPLTENNRSYEEYSQFQPYINGNDINRSFMTLDEAIVSVIAYKSEGANSQAAQYFMKMIATQ